MVPGKICVWLDVRVFQAEYFHLEENKRVEDEAYEGIGYQQLYKSRIVSLLWNMNLFFAFF